MVKERIFSKCLNSEPKAFNCSIGSIIGGVTLFVVAGLGMGLMYGIGFSTVGFVVGGVISRNWFSGDLQRSIFWYMPYSKWWISRNIPESHIRRLL